MSPKMFLPGKGLSESYMLEDRGAPPPHLLLTLASVRVGRLRSSVRARRGVDHIWRSLIQRGDQERNPSIRWLILCLIRHT